MTRTRAEELGPIRPPFTPAPSGDRPEVPASGPRLLDCSSDDIKNATPAELVTYLSTHDYDACLRFLWQLDDNVRTVMTEAHLLRVDEEITARSPCYDGTNAGHLREIIGFLRVAHYHDFYHDDLDFSGIAPESIAALTEFAGSAHFNNFNDDAAKVLQEWINAADAGGFWKSFGEPFQRVLRDYLDEQARQGDYRQVANALSVAYSLRRPPADVAAVVVDAMMLDLLRRHSVRSPVNDNDLVLVNNMIWTVGTLCRVPGIKPEVVAILEDARAYHPPDSEPYFWAGEALDRLCG